jgi:outer membrane lipoprotein-sorting protein
MNKLFYLLLISMISSLHNLQAQDATTIIKKADEKLRGKTSQIEMTIKMVRPTWSREMSVKAWVKGTDLSIILIQAPAKDKGMVYLKRKKEVWYWMPALERIIKLPPSMMNQSWMGTDFTNDDLVKESSIVDDYNHSIIGDTVIDNMNCYILQLLPKPDAAVLWGKLIICIDKKDYLELHTKFYDEDGKLIKIMNAYDVKLMDERLIPTHSEMIPLEKPNQKTEMVYKSVQYNRPIEDGFFTAEKMKTVN